MNENQAKKDELIDEFLKDPLYKVTPEGKIYTKLTLNGQGVSEDWREMGYKKHDGYVRCRYKDQFLFLHRIIFRKYCGPLDPNKTVNHKNLKNWDNHPKNLELITQGDNNKKKRKKYRKKSAEIVKKVLKKLATM